MTVGTRMEMDRWDEQLMMLLPPRLAAPVRRMRNPHLAVQVLDLIKTPLEARLANVPKIEVDEILPTGVTGWQRVPMFEVRDALDKLARDKGFVRSLWNAAKEVRKREHVRRHYCPDAHELPEALRDTTPPKNGTWYVMADLGLGTASHLEAMPDTVAGWVARSLLADRAKRILYVTTGASTLTAAIDVVADEDAKVRVHEVSVLGDGAPLADDEHNPIYRCLACRSYRMPKSGEFDAAVIHLPAPAGPGAGRHRTHYPKSNDVTDVGTQPHRKWARMVMAYLVRALSVLRRGGTLVLYLPRGIRLKTDYVVLEDVLAPISEALARMAVTVIHEWEVVEVEPVRQPFIGTHRCPWQLVVGTKEGEP